MPLRSFVMAGATALVGVACTLTTADSSNPISGGATPQQVGECKKSCDKMKFFDCSSADEQARCYADCDQAASSQVQLFVGCATNSVCDPQCRTNITPKPANGGSAQGTGATPSSCTSACDKLVQCSLLRVGDKEACAGKCAKSAYQYQIDCVNTTACDKVQSTCGGPETDEGGGTDAGNPSSARCQASCDRLNFFSCISAADHAACRDLCENAARSKSDSFSACAETSGTDCSKGSACYAQLEQ